MYPNHLEIIIISSVNRMDLSIQRMANRYQNIIHYLDQIDFQLWILHKYCVLEQQMHILNKNCTEPANSDAIAFDNLVMQYDLNWTNLDSTCAVLKLLKWFKRWNHFVCDHRWARWSKVNATSETVACQPYIRGFQCFACLLSVSQIHKLLMCNS